MFSVYIASFLSNYQATTIIIKLTLSIGLILSIFIYNRRIFTQRKINLQEWIFVAIITYFTTSLLWSSNKSFGVLKIIQIISTMLPLWFTIRSGMLSHLQQEINIILKFFLIFNIVLSVYIIFAHPISYSDVGYTYKKISGVISGRFLVLSIFLTVFFLHKKYLRKLVSNFLLYLYTTALSLVTYRAGIISIFLILLLNVFLSTKKKSLLKDSIIFLSTFLLGITSSLFLSPNLPNRFEWISDFNDNREIVDVTITARIEAFQTSILMFVNSPFYGQGLGGFNSVYRGNEIGENIKYPHNIFLELLSETGLIGTIMFTLAIYFSFKKMIQMNNSLYFLFFTLMFLLSLFSKDLSTNIIIIAPLLLRDDEYK